MDDECNQLMESLTWARHFAGSCTSKLPAHLDHEDLQSAGVLGYLRAASRYDASRGASFRGYCARRIQGAVLDELRQWDWAPRSVHKSQRRITRATSDLTERLDREPSHTELAKALGMEEGELTDYQTQAETRHMHSFDETTENEHGEECLSLAERLADPAADRPDAAMLSAEDRRILLQCLGCLPKSQSTVIVLHYLQNVALRDVAKILTVTPSRVSQLHHQALVRLKQAWDHSHV
jgi:RNA polymerase sigma factor for flagellar operon FliA